MFVTESDNTDPFTREGLPIASRQLLLTELQVFDLMIRASLLFVKGAATSRSSRASSRRSASITNEHKADFSKLVRQATGRHMTGLIDIASLTMSSDAGSKNSVSSTPIEQHRQLAVLCQRLARHILREHGQNKRYGVRFVPQVQTLLGLGVQAAETLR